jgi:hypothetical protein
VRQAIDEHRRRFRELLRERVAAGGYPDPDRTADILVALWDGLLVSSSIDGLGQLKALARDAVTRVLDARR